MDLFSRNRNLNIIKQEAFILEETRKDNKVVKKTWKKNRFFQILTLILAIVFMLSIIL